MAYADETEVRFLSGLSAEEIDKTTLKFLINRALRVFFEEIAVFVSNRELKPSLKGVYVNGTNREFYTAHLHIADGNLDGIIDASDVAVFCWTDPQDEGTKAAVAVSSIIPETGRLILAAAPPATVKKLTADYWHYLREPNWDLFRMAHSYLSAYFAILHLNARLPRRLRLPELTVFAEDLGKPFLDEYHKILSKLVPVVGCK